MKKAILMGLFILLGAMQAPASDVCFIAKEKDKVLKQEGDCKQRYSPCSTFKIPLSLMGYDHGTLVDAQKPLWEFRKGYADDLDVWKQNHTPIMWMKNSCIWYSQLLTQRIGIDRFKAYVKRLSYGNQDVSGDVGKNNGLTNAWLDSSLAISPLEQTEFLQRMLDHKLHMISPHAYHMTRSLLFADDLPDGWSLYGKTGSGRFHGWFVGWIEKDKRAIVFATHITDKAKMDTFPSARAKAAAKEKLLEIIQPLTVCLNAPCS